MIWRGNSAVLGKNLSQRHFFLLQKPRGFDWDRTRAPVGAVTRPFGICENIIIIIIIIIIMSLVTGLFFLAILLNQQ
jgi:hypothetical protein